MATYKNGINSRKAIIDTARRLFYEKGFRATTYHDISQEAKVRNGSISYHFENLLAIAAQIEDAETFSVAYSAFRDKYRNLNVGRKYEPIVWPLASRCVAVGSAPCGRSAAH